MEQKQNRTISSVFAIFLLIVLSAFAFILILNYAPVQEVEMSEAVKNNLPAYADIVSIEPVHKIASNNGFQLTGIICKCTTVERQTVWIYLSPKEYRDHFDSNAAFVSRADPFQDDSAPKVKIAPAIRIHGKPKNADDIVYKLSRDIGCEKVLVFKSISDNEQQDSRDLTESLLFLFLLAAIPLLAAVTVIIMKKSSEKSVKEYEKINIVRTDTGYSHETAHTPIDAVRIRYNSTLSEAKRNRNKAKIEKLEQYKQFLKKDDCFVGADPIKSLYCLLELGYNPDEVHKIYDYYNRVPTYRGYLKYVDKNGDTIRTEAILRPSVEDYYKFDTGLIFKFSKNDQGYYYLADGKWKYDGDIQRKFYNLNYDYDSIGFEIIEEISL